MKMRFRLKIYHLEVGIWSMIVQRVLEIHHILEVHLSLEVRRFKSFWLVVVFVSTRVKKVDFLSFLFGFIGKIFLVCSGERPEQESNVKNSSAVSGASDREI